MARNIKPENWQVLAGTVIEVLCVPGNGDMAHRIANTIRDGHPKTDYLEVAVAQLLRCIRRSYSGWEVARAQSLLETFQNYGLITADLKVIPAVVRNAEVSA